MRDTARIAPVKMPRDAVGSTTRKTTFHCGTPRASAASRLAERDANGTMPGVCCASNLLRVATRDEKAHFPAPEGDQRHGALPDSPAHVRHIRFPRLPVDQVNTGDVHLLPRQRVERTGTAAP